MTHDLKEKMEKTVEHTKAQFATYRTGRANPEVLSRIQVEYYGQMVSIKQVASVSVPETMTLQLSVFDKSAVKNVEKAILASDLGLNPSVDGTVIRLRFPELTEQRRKDLVKVIKKHAEESKVVIRNARRDYLEGVKTKEKNKEISEDDLKKLQDEVQKLTDQYIHMVDQITAEKEADIMRI